MYTSVHHELPELQTLLEALMLKRSVLQLKTRLLKGLKTELRVARDSGLTWLVIWTAMRDAGYPGSYPNFCRTAKSLIESDHLSTIKSNKILPPPNGEKADRQPVATKAHRNTNQEEKPTWQVEREETMARLDREAERNRKMESKLSRPKIFDPPPFVGRGE
jgi:hypothetical protein